MVYMFREEGDLGGGTRLQGLGLPLGLLDLLICHGDPVNPVYRFWEAVESSGTIPLPVTNTTTKPTQICAVSRPSSLHLDNTPPAESRFAADWSSSRRERWNFGTLERNR